MNTEEKMRLAEMLRTSSISSTSYPQEYLDYEKQETVQKIMIPTRHGNTPVYIHRPAGLHTPCPVFINMHGGGFVRPLLENNTRFCSMLAARTGFMIMDIDYKLAPEYPFPTAFEECYDVVKWMFDYAEELEIRPDMICLGGHSAGANLTAAIALKANQTGDFKIRLQILDYGIFDMATEPEKKRGIEGNLLSFERMNAFNSLYTDDNLETVRNPYASPSFAPDKWLTGLPETLLITGGSDCFRFEGEDYGMRLISAGVRVTMQRFADSPHGFTVSLNGCWQEAQDLISRTLKQLCCV